MQESEALTAVTQLYFPSLLSANDFVSSEKDEGVPPETALRITLLFKDTLLPNTTSFNKMHFIQPQAIKDLGGMKLINYILLMHIYTF